MGDDYRALALQPDQKPLPGRRILQPVLLTLVRTLTRPRIVGATQLPASGPSIVIYNHLHAIDPFVVISLLPRYGVPLSKIENFDIPFFGPLIRHYGVIPVKRGEADLQAVRASDAVLRAGHVLLMAPEGTRSRDGRLQQGKEGLVLLARKSDPVIVPLAFTGSPGFKEHVTHLRRTPVTLRYGAPFRFRWPEARPNRDQMRIMTDAAMARLAGLLPAEMRGVYSAPDPAWEAWLRP